jgi:hypothetical protein
LFRSLLPLLWLVRLVSVALLGLLVSVAPLVLLALAHRVVLA